MVNWSRRKLCRKTRSFEDALRFFEVICGCAGLNVSGIANPQVFTRSLTVCWMTVKWQNWKFLNVSLRGDLKGVTMIITMTMIPNELYSLPFDSLRSEAIEKCSWMRRRTNGTGETDPLYGRRTRNELRKINKSILGPSLLFRAYGRSLVSAFARSKSREGVALSRVRRATGNLTDRRCGLILPQHSSSKYHVYILLH